MATNRFDEAKTISEEAVANKTDTDVVHMALFDLAFLRGDQAEMARQVSGQGDKGQVTFLLLRKASAQSAHAEMKAADATYRAVEESAKQAGLSELASVVKATQAFRKANYGDCVGARPLVKAALTLSPKGPAMVWAALTLAQCDEDAEGQKLIEASGKDRPSDTLIHGLRIPVIKAMSQLHHGNPAGAAQSLEVARPYEAGVGVEAATYLVPLLRGQAFFQMKKNDEAIAEFQKILGYRGRHATSHLIPLAQLWTARAQVAKGDNAKAKLAFQDLLATWKNADPDVPMVVQAKAEYAKLQ
jgi:hypothetical protein